MLSKTQVFAQYIFKSFDILEYRISWNNTDFNAFDMSNAIRTVSFQMLCRFKPFVYVLTYDALDLWSPYWCLAAVGGENPQVSW